jgi:hypothetical protein
VSHIELDDQILNHPKFIRAIDAGGSDVWLLWCGLRAYCAQQLSDGFIPNDMLLEVRGPRDAKKRKAAMQVLKDKQLVHDAPGGVTLHDYLDWADSREEILMWRKKARDRKRKERGTSRLESPGESQRDGQCDSDVPSRSISEAVTPVVTDTSRARMGVGVVVVEDPVLQGSPEGTRKPRVKDPMGDSFIAPTNDERMLYETYRIESGKTGVRFDDTRSVWLECVRAGVTPGQVQTIVQGAKKEKFAVDRGLVPSLLLGTSGQREKYMALARAAPPKPKNTPPQPNNTANPYPLRVE